MDFLKKPGLIIAIIAIIGLGSFVIREIFPKKTTETVIQDKIVWLHDTINIEKVVYKHLPAQLESVFVKETTWVASVDTILPQFGDTLAIWYYFPPVNAFDFSFRPTPRPVEYKYLYRDTTVYVKVEESDFWGGLAVNAATTLMGFGLGKIIK